MSAKDPDDGDPRPELGGLAHDDVPDLDDAIWHAGQQIDNFQLVRLDILVGDEIEATGVPDFGEIPNDQVAFCPIR